MKRCDMQNLRSRLDRLIVKLSNGTITELELNNNTDLVVDAFFDSLTIIQCVVEIEEEFEIEFEDKDLLVEKIQNYKWLVEYVEQKVCGQETADE